MSDDGDRVDAADLDPGPDSDAPKLQASKHRLAGTRARCFADPEDSDRWMVSTGYVRDLKTER